VEGKTPRQGKGEWDLLTIVTEVPGEAVMQNREENPVMLEPLPNP
jgi:hypothetical protein